MSAKRNHAPKAPAIDPFIGRRVRIRAEGEVLARYESGPTAPERVSVRIDGIITIVPVARVEVLP
jgi:hypothetical protein